MEEPKKILFVCVENAGRSQIAEGFFKKYAPSFEIISAGTNPSSQLNPVVVEVMKEIRIDLKSQKPKTLTSDMIKNSLIINMGCMDKDSCPALFVDNVEDWQILDPKGKSLEDVRKIRDHIEMKVKELINRLEKQENAPF